jgi:hypothetical protein
LEKIHQISHILRQKPLIYIAIFSHCLLPCH